MHSNCNVFESSQNHPPPHSWKNCLPGNWFLVPERLGTTVIIDIQIKGRFILKTQSVQFSRSVVSDSLRPHESQHARPPCPSPTSGVHSDSRPSSQWCHPAISSSVVPFSSCPQSLPASASFPMSQLFIWGGQSTGVSALASFLPKKSQGWSPSEKHNTILKNTKGKKGGVEKSEISVWCQ